MTASASIRYPQTFNRYSYVLNSPYKFTDPLGLLPETNGGFTGHCSAQFASCDYGSDNGGFAVTSPDSHSNEADNAPATEATATEGEGGEPVAAEPEPPPQSDQNSDNPTNPKAPVPGWRAEKSGVDSY